MRGVESCGLRGLEVDEGKKRVDGLVDRCPAGGSFIAVVVRRIDAFGDALEPGDAFDRASKGGVDAGANDAGKRAVIAFDAHDASGGDAEIARAEVADTNEIGCDECVFERDEGAERGLRAGEHVHREEEAGKGRGLVGYGLLEEIVGHLLLASGDEVALIVLLQRFKEGCDVDDV